MNQGHTTVQKSAKAGRRWPGEMTEAELQKELVRGLNHAAQHFRSQGLDNLAAAAGGDAGMEYLAEVQADEQLERASDVRHLVSHIRKIPRYQAMLQEMRGRQRQQAAFERIAARHAPR